MGSDNEGAQTSISTVRDDVNRLHAQVDDMRRNLEQRVADAAREAHAAHGALTAVHALESRLTALEQQAGSFTVPRLVDTVEDHRKDFAGQLSDLKSTLGSLSRNVSDVTTRLSGPLDTSQLESRWTDRLAALKQAVATHMGDETSRLREAVAEDVGQWADAIRRAGDVAGEARKAAHKAEKRAGEQIAGAVKGLAQLMSAAMEDRVG